MNEHPILFSAAMVQALLAGNKNMTRRAIRGIPEDIDPDILEIMCNGLHSTYGMVRCPYGKKGDMLYVREGWRDVGNRIEYAADVSAECKYKTSGWKPSIHLKKDNSRIWLQITSLSVERLHDITEQDAKSEGVKLHERGVKYLNYQDEKAGITQAIYNCDTAKRSFLTLWGLINDINPYRVNPWVWVVGFKVLSTTGKPSVEKKELVTA